MNKIIFTFLLLTGSLFGSTALIAQNGRLGVGTSTPTNKLHVVAAADPVRLGGLQAGNSATVGTLVVDTAGVIKVRYGGAISAADVIGTTSIATDGIFSFTDRVSTPLIADVFGEFSGHTFTPKHNGLYYVTFSATFPQRPSSQDGGNGYDAILQILAGTKTGAVETAPFYTGGANRIPIRQSGISSGGYTTVTVSALRNVFVGEVLQFKLGTSGLSPGNLSNVQYRIDIVRID